MVSKVLLCFTIRIIFLFDFVLFEILLFVIFCQIVFIDVFLYIVLQIIWTKNCVHLSEYNVKVKN